MKKHYIKAISERYLFLRGITHACKPNPADVEIIGEAFGFMLFLT
jgi:hypothetical protein